MDTSYVKKAGLSAKTLPYQICQWEDQVFLLSKAMNKHFIKFKRGLPEKLSFEETHIPTVHRSYRFRNLIIAVSHMGMSILL